MLFVLRIKQKCTIFVLCTEQNLFMDKNILKVVIADNQTEVPKYKVIPRNFTFEEFGNYVFAGIRRAGKSYLLYQRMQQLITRLSDKCLPKDPFGRYCCTSCSGKYLRTADIV